MLGRAILAVFGVRVTILYTSGQKVTMRFRQFDFFKKASHREVTWRTPILAVSRKPIYVNVDEIVAVFQGRV